MSSTEKKSAAPPAIPGLEKEYVLSELTRILLEDAGISSGHYELAVQFRVSTGRVGNDERVPLPGVALSVASVGLKRVDSDTAADSPFAVDASGLKSKKKTSRST